MSIKTIFLDAGGVLVNPNWQRVSETLRKHGVAVETEKLRQAEPFIKFALDKTELVQATSDQDRFLTYLEMIFARAECGTVPKAALDELHAYQSKFNLWESVDPNIYTALDQLRDEGYKLVVVSNSNGTLHRSFTRFGLIDKVDLIFDSHEHGVEKPDPSFFRLALKESQSFAGETVHVGDFYHIDIVGARNAGIGAVLLDSANLYLDCDCSRIRSLPELPLLLEQWKSAAKRQ
jgi:HAD superfamily hydrolase (TIGR01549 family)